VAGRKEELFFNEAERLYVAGYTLDTIREHLPEPVSLPTLSRWKDKGGWGEKRRQALASLRNVADILMEVLEEKIVALRQERGLNAGDFDAIAKATASIERLKKGAYDLRTVAVEVMGKFTEWLRKNLTDQEELNLVAKKLQAWFKSLE
jgi:hypothetical protein